MWQLPVSKKKLETVFSKEEKKKIQENGRKSNETAPLTVKILHNSKSLDSIFLKTSNPIS